MSDRPSPCHKGGGRPIFKVKQIPDVTTHTDLP